MIRRYLPKSTEELIQWYERYVSPLALIVGFLLDNFIFLSRIDSLQSYLIFSCYLLVAATAITLLHMIERGKWKAAIALRIAPYVPVVLQLVFGALFSGFLAVYWRSASVAVSWIFVIGIALLLIGNERFRANYMKLPFQVGTLFIVLFSFFIFLIPILFGRMGAWVFVLSGVVTVGAITLFVLLLRKLVPEIVREHRINLLRTIGALFLLFNVLYFTNAIPPLPLSLKDAGVYHSVRAIDGAYVLTEEANQWGSRFLFFRHNTVFHRAPGTPAYVYSSIYAPAGLTTGVAHEWQRKLDDGSWLTESTVPFSISGGREEGFRGYSQKSALADGKWRVNVITSNGQVIGRVSFTVVSASSTPPLVEVRR